MGRVVERLGILQSLEEEEEEEEYSLSDTITSMQLYNKTGRKTEGKNKLVKHKM